MVSFNFCLFNISLTPYSTDILYKSEISSLLFLKKAYEEIPLIKCEVVCKVQIYGEEII